MGWLNEFNPTKSVATNHNEILQWRISEYLILLKSPQVCNGLGMLMGEVACTGTAPYCLGGSCVSTIPAGSECAASTSFKCMANGYMPDPKNCRDYHLCDQFVVLKTFVCPSGYVYDSINFKCKRQVYTKDCVTFTCATVNSFIPYTPNKRYYVFCDSTLTPYMGACFEGEEFINNGCKFVCKADGNYPGRTDTQYWMCYRNSSNQWVAQSQTCPGTTVFNATKGYCV